MDRTEYQKQYYQKNKQRIIQRITNYNQKNKEKHRECNKRYYQKNKEKIKLKDKQCNQTESSEKSKRIDKWKRRGLKLYGYTYDEVYEYYLSVNICEVCEVKLNTNNKNQKCMDHCHITGCFRWVLCRNCNTNDNWIKKYPLSIYKF
jgi:hypothetical protein